MKLKRLLKEIPVKMFKGSKDLEITGICSNSKRVAPGNLFVARRGRIDDGTQYIPEAIAAGAVAVLTDIYDPSIRDVAQLVDPQVEKVEAALAAHYYQHAAADLFLVGITGTNGKTTTSFLVRHLLDKPQAPCGLIGTIEYIIGRHRYQATRTTPDVATNHKMLREMVLQGCRAAVMEVTSHALDQGRVAGIDFDIAVFTNLTLDHLDYHGTMERYAEAKQQLFLSLQPQKLKKIPHSAKLAVVNADDVWHSKMVEGCRAPILSYGINNSAHLQAIDVEIKPSGSEFTITYQGKRVRIMLPLIGRHNIYNALAATGVAIAHGITLDEIATKLKTAPQVPGRLQVVPNPLGLHIFVDFAHSDDALLNVLLCLKELKQGKLVTVFGCGGDRDRSKRPKMAQVSAAHSDLTIVTSDNPRSEDPDSIIREILQGMSKEVNYEIFPDRYQAIYRAIESAKPGDIVLIAGKGHEHTQVFAHKTIEFDDSKIAARICQELNHATV